MKQLKISILLVLTVIILCCRTEKGHEYITFINNSPKKIACQMVRGSAITQADTVYQCKMIIYGIDAGESFGFGASDYIWEYDFHRIPFIEFLVMDAETLLNYPISQCDSIRKYVPVLKWYQLKLEDLERVNWVITYPPDE